jgi:hypothetical protein
MKQIVKKLLNSLSMVPTSISKYKSGLIVIKCQPDAAVIKHIKDLMVSNPDSLVCNADGKTFKAVAYEVGDKFSDGTEIKFAYCHLREVKPSEPMSEDKFNASFDLMLAS